MKVVDELLMGGVGEPELAGQVDASHVHEDGGTLKVCMNITLKLFQCDTEGMDFFGHY